MIAYQKTKTILKTENISLTLGDTHILRDINIEIKDIVRPDCIQGQIVGLLGPSGIGKTKFFEVLAGILKPTTGNVLINETLEPVKLGKVGVVQQNYPLFEHRTIYGNLEIAARNKLTDKNERKTKINEILDRFGLFNRSSYYPAQLSGGQRQRIAIAQQILCANHFLLMDEPFSGLDINMIKEVSKTIVEVANMDELNTIIIVSHDMPSTAAISDTLLLFGRDRNEKGELIPGARIKYEFDLIERGLAWKHDIEKTMEFQQLIVELRTIFPTL
jgi:polar amino acid transport system ATP-binding protein/sulfate transport system ATP-binding protein